MLNAKEKNLKKYFGYSSFRASQEEIIDEILKGNDILGVMPTGAGKSICYEVPSLMMDGLTIVISPLIALMNDQVEGLKSKGIKAACVTSIMTSKDIYYTLENASKGLYKILYVAPERLSTPNFEMVKNSGIISMIAIDEAHCVSEWGHDFRPSYKAIKEFIESLSTRPIVACFTATATDKVKRDIKKLIGLKDPFEITTGFDRPNIYFRSIHTTNKFGYIESYLNKYPDRSGIIYCATRKDCELVRDVLKEKGYDSIIYHAGLSDRQREKAQRDFIYDKVKLIIATNAFGMGIDKPNVRFVIHYGMPKNIEGYYQEAGRCGRDGELSEAILLYNERDKKINEFMIEKSEELNDSNEQITDREKMILKKRDTLNLSKMYSYAKTKECLRGYILKYFGEDIEKNYNCNNCSNCYNKSKLSDITIESQKIMSTIKRVNEKEDRDVIISILTGVNDKTNKKVQEKIFDNKYDLLSTYKILRIPLDDLNMMIDHLLKYDYIEYSNTNNNKNKSLKVTSKGMDVLKKKSNVYARTSEDYNLIKKEKIRDKNLDEVLYKLLKMARSSISKKIRLPEFMIAQDQTLKDMARLKPKTMKDMMNIDGVGEYKAKKFGEVFIEVIDNYECLNKDKTKDKTIKKGKK